MRGVRRFDWTRAASERRYMHPNGALRALTGGNTELEDAVVGSEVHRTRAPIERDRVAAEHDKASPRIVELNEDVAKVVEELDHGRVRGTKRTGTPWRACPALAIPARLKRSMVRRVVSEMAAAPWTGVKSNSGSPSLMYDHHLSSLCRPFSSC